MDIHNIISLLICLFFSITFLESGFDKIINRESNLNWLKGHFDKTFLRKSVPFLFYWIMISETLLGFLFLYGIYCIFSDDMKPLYYIYIYCLTILLQLFAGQRIAKDYVGASGIIPYIILGILGITIYSLNL